MTQPIIIENLTQRHQLSIRTRFVYPPIPDCAWDWEAVVDGSEDIGSTVGRGPTECQAIADLIEQLDEEAK